MANLVQKIKNAFSRHPIVANSVLYGTFFLAAEVSQQTISKKILTEKEEPEPYDTGIIGRYLFYGPLIQGPIITVWYKWLDTKFVGKAVKVVVPKLLVDQFMFTPNLLVIFFVSMSILERREDIFAECREKIIPTFQTSCMFWLPVQSINFFLIPSAFRVAFISVSSLAWVNILCYLKRQSNESTDDKVEQVKN